MRVSEIRVKRIRVNQGLGVFWKIDDFIKDILRLSDLYKRMILNILTNQKKIKCNFLQKMFYAL